MNQCEKVMLDKMVELNIDRNEMKGSTNEYAVLITERVNDILLLLDCICEWRYQTSEPLESGCGKLVSAE